MYEFLIDISIQPLVANFIANPEWIHVGTAFALFVFIVGVAYLLRVDLDPFLFNRHQPIRLMIERLVFYAVIILILVRTYNLQPAEGQTVPETWHTTKLFTGCAAVFALVMARAVVHFILTEKNRWDFFDQLPFYLMVLFQFFVPLVTYVKFERNMLMPKEQLGFAMACIFIFYIVLRLLLGRPMHIPRNRVNVFLGFFIAYMLLTFLVFPYRLAAIKNIIQWIAFASCYFVGLALIPDRRRRNAVLLTMVVTALVCTLWGFWKYFDIPYKVFGLSQDVYPEGHDLAGREYYYKTPTAGRYFHLAGFFANPNYYGEYLAMTLFVALALLLSTSSKKLQIFLSVVLAINCFEMVAVYNRAGWFGIFFALGFAIFAIIYARIYVFKRISKKGLIGGIAVLAFVLIMTGIIFNRRETDETPLSYTPWERLKSMTDFSEDETFRNRLTMWRASRIMLTDPVAFPQRLVFGGGFGFFEIEYLPYQTKVLETYDFNEWFHNVIPTFRAHNDHVQMLVEAGIIGTFFYAMFFIIFFTTGLKFIRDAEDVRLKLHQ